MKDFKELKVWEKAHELTLSLYSLSKGFPKEELYGLTSQLRRSAVSVCANIAEGCGRRSDGEFVRFLQISRGSASELEYHLLLSRDLGLMERECARESREKAGRSAAHANFFGERGWAESRACAATKGQSCASS